jgi:single-strand DNA-binding protein
MPASNINHLVLTGRLTRDPDLRPLPSGGSVCELRVAVNSRRLDPSSGEWVEKPNYFDIVLYGAPGENVARHLHKGRAVAIDGRLDWREWETQDGRHAQAVNVVARTVQFLDSPRRETNGLADEGAGALHSIAAEEEESLDIADQDAIAALAATG